MPRVKKSAQLLLAQWASMTGDRAQWDALWDEVLRFVMPWKKRFYATVNLPDQNPVTYDSTPIWALNTLAGGMLSYLTPGGSDWFGYTPPAKLSDSDEVKQWLQKCTEITLQNLATSNFYDEIHVSYYDLCGPGTATIIVQEGKRNPFFFRSVPIGTYCIAEDDEGHVDTLFLIEDLTARQCEMKFGRDNLSAKLQKALDDISETGKGSETKYQILHAVYPRSPAEMERGKKDKQNKPFASCYVEIATKHELPESGIDEQNFFSFRFAKWGSEVWGVSPALQCMPDIRQLDFLAMSMDALVDKKVTPPMLAPGSLAGQIDVRSGGVTYWDNPAEVPKEWAPAGDYNCGADRENRKQDMIKKAFYVDMIQMFASYDGPRMTATEANERQAEKLVQFIPTFARMTTELLGPLLERLFAMQLRAGLFPPPPEEAQVMLEGASEPVILPPTVQYSSRIALAIKQLAVIGLQKTFGLMVEIAPFDPSIWDNIDLDKAIRDTARSYGVSVDWLRESDEVKQLRDARAQAQHQQEQMQQALAASQAAKNVGSIPADSPAGAALASQAA